MFSSSLHLVYWQTDSPWALQRLVALWYLLDPLAPVHKQKHLGHPFPKHITHVIIHILHVHRKSFKTYYVTFETLWTSLTLKSLWKKHPWTILLLIQCHKRHIFVCVFPIFFFFGKMYLWSWMTRWASISLDPSRPLEGTIRTVFAFVNSLRKVFMKKWHKTMLYTWGPFRPTGPAGPVSPCNSKSQSTSNQISKLVSRILRQCCLSLIVCTRSGLFIHPLVVS